MCRHPAEGHWPQQVNVGNPADIQAAVSFVCLMSCVSFSAAESKMNSRVNADDTDRASNFPCLVVLIPAMVKNST